MREEDAVEGIGRTHHDVGLGGCRFRLADRNDLDPEQSSHLRREGCAVLRVGAEATDGVDVAHGASRHQLGACQPEPRMPTLFAFSRARYLMPSPLAAPTRIRCMTPSGRIASGSPFSTENSRISPT